jgi:predicted methyltransferase
MIKHFMTFSFIFALTSCNSTPAKVEAPSVLPLPSTIEEAVNSSYRNEANRPRDQYRHPVETLNFFGLKPGMTVVEISPGAGWYLEILAPLLAGQGRYIGARVPSETGANFAKMNANIDAWIMSNPQLEGNVKFVNFEPPAPLAEDGSVDMILTFRNVHNWMANGSEQAAFDSFFKALRPGGVLGVVEHRADAKSKRDPKAISGYVRESDVIAMAKKAGFKLEAKSEINANPKDTKDYPDGVWTLPPVLRLGDKDREKYLAIGESDRMTLRFVKPSPHEVRKRKRK